MKVNIALMVLATLAPWHAAAADPVRNLTEQREHLTFRYAEFVHAFRSRSWDHVCTFVDDDTQTGFGPGETGCDGIHSVFADNEQCWEDMQFALRQGCRINQEASGCTSPPQLKGNVAYLGARASFDWDHESDRLKAGSLICGGD